MASDKKSHGERMTWLKLPLIGRTRGVTNADVAVAMLSACETDKHSKANPTAENVYVAECAARTLVESTTKSGG